MTLTTIPKLALQFGYWQGKLKYSNHLLAVFSFRDASLKWTALRYLKGWKMHTAPVCRVIDLNTFEPVAMVSYNGRIWDTEGKEIQP